MAKTEQSLLSGKGTVEQHEKSMKMFEQLFEALFTRPIIGHTGWAESITEEQKLRIKMERMKQIQEAMIYLSTVSLSTPLSPMWQRIYMHLFKKFYPDKSDFIPDHDAQLNPWMDEDELKKLKRWLYKTSKVKTV